MKGIRGRILKKLRSIPQVPYLKHQERVLHVHASVPSLPTPPDPSRVLRDLPVGSSRVEEASNSASSDDQLTPVSHLHDVVDVAELMRDFEEEEEQEEAAACDEEESDHSSSSRSSIGDKENSRPPPSSPPKEASSWRTNDEEDQHGRENETSYRRPDLDSVTLFDPELLAAFEKAVVEHMRSFEEAKSRARARIKEEEYDEHDGGGGGEPHGVEEPPSKVPRTDDDDEDPLTEFEHRCPPGGRESVILYTTTLRGIRKTFEDCNGVRFLLDGLKVRFTERDVSMHLEFREELWRVLGYRAIPPSLFIRGRYVGGADEVLGLHEQGRLLALLRGAPRDRSAGEEACRGCGGVRFVVCWECNGSRKIYHGEEEEDAGAAQCRHCNENGLVVCPICC